ncbi:MAG: hypothetical protein JXB13_06260 [Phycisphaerae bacterium]|nr:hypothetical protein [Phycisphaerae bacterium]
MFRRLCLTGMLTIAAFGLLIGCSLDPADCAVCRLRNGGSGQQDPPETPAGELGGECLPDGTCADGLVCADDTCVQDATADTLLIFHNNTGPMCLAALGWLEEAQADHGALIVEEHLTTESGERDLLHQLEDEYPASEGVSTTFGYLPIIFFKDRAFSGFNDEVEASLGALLGPEDAEMP